MNDDLKTLLDKISQRLSMIEARLPAQFAYSVPDSVKFLNGSYAEYTLRQACNKGRVKDAFKTINGKEWRIPHTTLLDIASRGLPLTTEKLEVED